MQKKPNILVAGSFVMDLIAQTERVPQAGQTVVGTAFHMAPGGKGVNQAVQCARLGADVTMLGCVGDDAFGSAMLAAARGAGVDVSRVKVDPLTSSGVGHVLLETSGHTTQNRITVIPGANQSLRPEDVAWIRPNISRYDMVMLQMEIPMEVNLAIARWAAEEGVPVMLNPAPAGALNDELLSRAEYLTPNEQEASAETGCPLKCTSEGFRREDLMEVAGVLRRRGARRIIITLGSWGSAIAEPDGVRFVPTVPIPHAADPTAAGDSFTAALCMGLCSGLSEDQALTFASHTAALTVSRVGAIPSLPNRREVEAFLRERKCRLPVFSPDASR